MRGAVGPHLPVIHADDNDFVQAGALYRLISDESRQRLIDNLAGSLAQVTREDPSPIRSATSPKPIRSPGSARRLPSPPVAVEAGELIMQRNTPTAAPDLDAQALGLVQDALQFARSGDFKALRNALDVGVAVDVCNDKGDSLLMLASDNGHMDVTGLLLERGADPELRNLRGQSPLDGAASKGDLVIAMSLLASDANVNGTAPDGKTPLMYAAMFDQVAMTDFLLKNGADPDRCDSAGNTAGLLTQSMGAQRRAERLSGG
ncbi:MAG: ankyrin repeat domain-containing protein [Candidatus Sericytochromatia bacterium]|nr:ankyrin repeat domain-containing protein [Candidatus Sericytochromatia bacterium]